MNDDLDPKQINAFWSWLLSHQSDLDTLQSPDDEFWDVLLARLQAVNAGLWFEVSVPGENDREFVITAQGDWELFPLVDALVSVAPDVPGWTFVPLKPPMGFDFGIRYEGVELEPKNIWFEPMVDPDAPEVLGLRIAVLGFNDDQEQDFANGLLLILDTALGEKSAATDVDLVEVCEMPENPEEEGFLPLPELGSYVEWRKSRATH
ncbi:hypothetical protein SAMN05216359_102146 [Roseateles sp. YR242]|uniref:hypothetical protein n=1 Tax=Roseateles sp. YR242 TaxID=1855305 RepID=UPI0008D73C23|nr:hypothetical protein [Roseateles sp. YR242]SEK54251.1 hypothetical protein SAMN05216359_102146 [Roseateles sp. YR242]